MEGPPQNPRDKKKRRRRRRDDAVLGLNCCCTLLAALMVVFGVVAFALYFAERNTNNTQRMELDALCDNVTTLDTNLDTERQQRESKDMVLMQNMTTLQEQLFNASNAPPFDCPCDEIQQNITTLTIEAQLLQINITLLIQQIAFILNDTGILSINGLLPDSMCNMLLTPDPDTPDFSITPGPAFNELTFASLEWNTTKNGTMMNGTTTGGGG